MKKVEYKAEITKPLQLLKILLCLRKSRALPIKIKLECEDKSMISMLQEKLTNSRKAREVSKSKSFSCVYKKNQMEGESKYLKKIIFNSNYLLAIFVHEYKLKLKSMESEFGVRMTYMSNIIHVHSDTPISTIFESRILEMKQKLKWIVFIDEPFYNKCKYSNYLVQRLLAQKMQYFLLKKENSVVFHSSHARIEDMIALKKALSYDALVLKFNNWNKAYQINRIHFHILEYHLAPFLMRISQNYEIKSQININKLGVVLHTQDPVFSQQPKMELQIFLQRIIHISYYTKNQEAHLVHIQQNLPKGNCLQFLARESIIYTCWNANLRISPQQVAQVFRLLVKEVSLQTFIKISFNVGGLSLGLIDRVEEIGEKHRLDTAFPILKSKREETIHVKVKSVINKKHQRNNILMFLQEVLTGTCCPISKFKSSNHPKAPPISPTPVISTSSEEHQNDDSNEEEELSKRPAPPQVEVKVKEELNQGLCFNYVFQKPSLNAMLGNGEVRKGKRSKQLEKLIFKKLEIVCKIWNLEIGESEHLSAISRIQDGTKCQIYIMQKTQKPFLSEKLQDFPTATNIGLQKQYLLVSKLDKPFLSCATHLMIMYS